MYPWTVSQFVTIRARTVGWFLCVFLTCFALYSPHCDACDRVSITASASKSSVERYKPALLDTCNGVCSCCALQGFPTVAPVLEASGTVLASHVPTSRTPAPAKRSTLFRPPRSNLS